MDWSDVTQVARQSWQNAEAIFAQAEAFCVGCWAVVEPHWIAIATFLSNPWARAIGLAIIVYLTIRVIASVYSGDKQNSQLGPIGIRPHSAQRLDRSTIVLPRLLMPMNMDGVHATIKIYYGYLDARGKRCKRLVHTHRDARISVSPTRLNRVSSTIYGQEIPDVATSDVCFPPVELDSAPDAMPATPERARDYAVLHKIIENWSEDDDALLVSLHADEHETIKDNREQFILGEAKKVAAARSGNFLQRWLNRDIPKRRPNVVGSYFVKLEFSHNPWFVLTRHPDRELKMTAWLTVLTSAFALIMDAWPKAPSVNPEFRVPGREAPARAPRIPAAQK
ncbi:MAG: hypothetical protein ACK4S3_10250 [Parvibaculum sp.]